MISPDVLKYRKASHPYLGRREFLVAGGLSDLGLDFAGRAAAAPARRSAARSAILIWLSGGASPIDTWDMKPDAPAE